MTTPDNQAARAVAEALQEPGVATLQDRDNDTTLGFNTPGACVPHRRRRHPPALGPPVNRQQHWQAAYRERYGGDLDALADEAFHPVPAAGDPMRRARGGTSACADGPTAQYLAAQRAWEVAAEATRDDRARRAEQRYKRFGDVDHRPEVA